METITIKQLLKACNPFGVSEEDVNTKYIVLG